MIAIFPETLASAAKGDVEELAVTIRRYYGGEDTFAPCPDMMALAARVGIAVDTLPIEGVGALVAKDEGGVFTTSAFLSPLVEKSAVRFLIAHLLGHYFFDIQPAIARGEWQSSGFREASCPLRRYTQADLSLDRATYELAKDMRADLFAGALLMPMGMLRRAMETLKDNEKTARFFGVSRPCLDRRLMDLGLLNQEPVNFLDAEVALERERPQKSVPSAPPALNPPADASMPRSFAASTYGQTARATAAAAPEAVAQPRPVGSRTMAGGSGGRGGLQRLREIARQLDKTSDPKSET